jgi:hypothetical protein
LERKLQQRPDADFLQSQGVLKEGGRFAAAQDRLQRELRSDAVARAIDHRPTREELETRGIAEGMYTYFLIVCFCQNDDAWVWWLISQKFVLLHH